MHCIVPIGPPCVDLGVTTEQLNAFALTELADLLETAGTVTVISGLEPGWDHAVAKTALGIGLNLHIVIPYCGWEMKWSAGFQKKCQTLIDECFILTYMSTDRTHDDWPANSYMVSIADAAFVLMPAGYEKPKERGQGTYGRLWAANMQKKQIVDVWPSFRESGY